ncbi:hypothetical protein BU17DRAFT_79879 [Hysterangium stoloniferum]|nr:hypothetical protein BU17DRAFT_79879 [Hysterangium stoloniferum]
MPLLWVPALSHEAPRSRKPLQPHHARPNMLLLLRRSKRALGSVPYSMAFASLSTAPFPVKHVNIKYYFLRERVHAGDFTLQYVNTKDNLADISWILRAMLTQPSHACGGAVVVHAEEECWNLSIMNNIKLRDKCSGQQRDPGPGQPHEMAHRQRAAVVKYKCDFAGCDAALFSSKENARGHVWRTHFRQLDQKPFKCLHPEWFASLSAARRHVKDKAKARYPDCKKLLGQKNYVSTTYRKHCKGRKHLAKAGLVTGA